MPWSRHLGGYPYPIMLCNITQNSMGQKPGGGGRYPARSRLGGGYPAGGYPAGGVPCQGVPCRGYPVGGTQVGYPLLGQDGATLPEGGTQVGYPARGAPGRVPSLAG